MRPLLLIPVCLLCLLLAAMFWSGEGRLRRADFVFINRGEINTLDPNRMSWLQDIRVGDALWEGLYALDPVTLEPIPGSAGQIDISPDKTVYTFHIRPEARWSNGDDLTAADFVFAWKRMFDQPGDYTYLLNYIQGAQAYQQAAEKGDTTDFSNVKKGVKKGDTADFSKVGIEILDPKTLRVTLNHPVTFFPDLCAFPPLFPLHEPSMRQFAHRDAAGRVTYDSEFTRPPNLVTNGPYRLASWEFHRRMRLEASPFYWDRSHVRSRTIEMLSFEDSQAQFLAYEAGTVDWLASVPSDIAAEMLAAGRKDLRIFPGFGTYFYSVNCAPLPGGAPNPFTDVRVRRAFSMAIDKRPIVDTITRLGQPVATTFIPPGAFTGYRGAQGIEYDPARARSVLAEAGYPGGRGFPRVSILFNSEGDHKTIAENIRNQWAGELGVTVELENVELNTFRQRLHHKDYVLARASWTGDYNDPSTFIDKYRSYSENNDSAWKSGPYDQLCDDAAREPDPVRRLEMLRRAEQILCDQAPIIPLYHYVETYLFRDNIEGVALNRRDMVVFKAVARTPRP